MRRIVLLGSLVVAAAALPSQSSFAYREGEWCAIYSIGFDTSQERCDFATFEECRREALLWGSTAFCNLNPRYRKDWSRQPQRRPRNGRRHNR